MPMHYKLSETTSRDLLALPETGMGFQFVEGYGSGQFRQLLVLNAEDAFDVTDLQLLDQGDLLTILLNSSRVISAIHGANLVSGTLSLSSMSVAPPRVSGGNASGGSPDTSPSGPAAVVAPPSSLTRSFTLTAIRMFYRYSAYNPDKRVAASSGDFLAGTYATTDSDLTLVTSGFGAVGRYALPSPKSALYRYEINASVGTALTTGTVVPAFGQAGGGVEAFFALAVSNTQSPPVVTIISED